MALPTYRAAGVKSTGTTGAVTVAAPAGVATGDLEILIATTIAGGSITITANGGGAWTVMTGSPIDIASGEKLYVWWRIRVGGDGDPDVTPGSDHSTACRIAVTAGTFDPVTPIEAKTTGTDSGSNTAFSFTTGGTTTRDNALCFVICSSGVDSNTGQAGTNTANAALANIVMQLEYQTTNGGGGGFWVGTGEKGLPGDIATWSQTLVGATTKAYISFAVRRLTQAVELVQANSAYHGAASPSVVLGAAPTQGNLLLAFISGDGTKVVSSLSGSGWTLADAQSSAQWQECWWKIAGAGESATITVSAGGNSNNILSVLEYSGVDATTPVLAIGGQLNISGTYAAPSTTPTASKTVMAVSCISAALNTAWSAEQIGGTATDVFERTDRTGANGVAHCVADKFIASTSGSYTSTANPASGSNVGAGQIVFLQQAAGAVVNNLTFTVTCTTTPTLVKSVGKVCTKTVTTTPSFTKSVGKLFTKTATVTPTFVKAVGLIRSVTATATASFTSSKVINLIFAATATCTASFIKSVGQTFSKTTTGTPSFTKSIDQTHTKTVTGTPSFTKSIAMTLIKTVTGTASWVKEIGQTFSTTSATTPTFTKSVAQEHSTTVTGTPSFVKSVGLISSVTSTVTATFSKALSRALTFAVTATTTASFTKSVAQEHSTTVTATPSFIKSVGLHFAKTVTGTASAVIDFVSHESVVFDMLFEVTVNTTASFSKSVGKLFSKTVTGTPTVTKEVGLTRSTTVTGTPSFTKSVGKVFSKVVTVTPSLTKLVSVTHRVTAAVTPSFVKRVGKTFSVTAHGTPSFAVHIVMIIKRVLGNTPSGNSTDNPTGRQFRR